MLTSPDLGVDWEFAVMDSITDLASGGLTVELAYRQEARDAGVVLVAYAAASHGAAHVEHLIAQARSTTAPPGTRLCVAACDWSPQQVTRQDVAVAAAGPTLCFADRFFHPSELGASLSDWIRATAMQLGGVGNPPSVRSSDGETDTQLIGEDGGTWNTEII